MADELERSFFDDLDDEMLLKMGACEYKRSLNLLSTLNKFRNEGESGFCDVILETEGRHFWVHRCVLAANSQFFYTMFNSGMRESKEKILRLPSLSCVAMENILDFFYTQEIRLTDDIIVDILEASSFLLLEPLKKTCIEILSSKISLENCFSTKRLAMEYNAVELLGNAEDFIEKNVLRIVKKSKEFLELSLKELCELMSNQNIRVLEETQVYYAAIKWVKHEVSVRSKHLPVLIKQLNMKAISSDFWNDELENEPLLQDGLYKTIIFNKCNDSEKQKDMTINSDCVRPSMKIHNVLVGVGTGKCYRAFCYDTEDGDTYILPNLPKIQAFPCTVVIDKSLYILGGESQRNINFDPVNSLRMFPFNVERADSGLHAGWVRKPSFREVRRDIAAVVHNEKIYVIGGWMSGAVGSVECYDSGSSTWSCVAPLCIPRSQLAAISTPNGILAIGGSRDQVVGSTTVEQYNPSTNSWSFLQPMTTRRLFGNVIFVHGKVYVIGGYDNAFDRISNCESYDPSTKVWCTIPPLPDLLHTNQSVVALNNEIIAITGSPEIACKAVWYNSDANIWEKIQNFRLNFNIAGYRLCCLQVKKYFLQELPKAMSADIAEANENSFPKQEYYVEESHALVGDLGLFLSEDEQDDDSDSDEWF